MAALLTFRRTRRAGLLLALSFHWLLALDWSQHFWDFSSVLFAGFVLFADDATLDKVRSTCLRAWTHVPRPVRPGIGGLALFAFAVVAVAAVMPSANVYRGLAILAGHAAWVVWGTGVVALVTYGVVRTRSAGDTAALRVGLAGAVLPALVFVNGVTPYLEVKTGFGWNMYSNLRTVAGESNHFLVPRTAPLTQAQRDRVQVLETSDAQLGGIIGSNFEIVYSEFREYAHEFPDAAVTYRRGRRTIVAPAIGDDAAGRGTVSELSRRVQSFRVVDVSGAQRCQSVFTPAR